MDIFINDVKIDFQLENEKSIKDIVSGLSGWASSEGVQLQNIRIDDKDYDSADSSFSTMELNGIGKIEVAAKSILQIHEENLQLLHQYISLMKKSVEGKNIKLIDDLKSDIDSVSALLADFLGEDIGAQQSISCQLKTRLTALHTDGRSLAAEETEPLLNMLTALDIILKERIAELANPYGELQKTVNAMKSSIEEINNISVLLQTGKDREALSSIIKFSELSQKVLRIYSVLSNSGLLDVESIDIDGMKFSDFYNELNSILTELLEAFTANDSVLIGDLLEYEIAPRSESLIKALELIRED